MQILLQICLLAAVASIFVTAAPQGRLRLSDEIVERALNDKRYLLQQLKCALGEAPCDAVGKRLKSVAPLVLQGSCPQCTTSEIRQIKRVLSTVQRTYPKEWNKLVQQYAG